MKRKLLVVAPSLGIGGQERIALNTVKCLQEDMDVELVIFQRKDIEYETDCSFVNLNYPAPSSNMRRIMVQIKRIRALRQIRQAQGIDFVFSLGLTANITNVFSGIFSKGKSIISIHGYGTIKKNTIYSFLFRHAAKIVCISKEMQIQLLKLYPKLQNTVVIENGYDLSAATESGQHRQDGSGALPKLVAMGRLEPVKRYDVLLKALRLICDKHPQIQLSFLGSGSEECALMRLAEELRLTENVSFLGYQVSQYASLAAHDIFLMTSRTEGFPNSLIEAMACGNAVVSVDCLTGPKEILSEQYDPAPVQGIQFEKFGVLVENKKDETELAQLFATAVVALIEDKGKRFAYQEAGRYRANEFSTDVYKRKLVSLFQEFE